MGEATGDPVTHQIEGDIERTRAHMGHAIETLKERLRPSQLVADAKETVKTRARRQVQGVVGRTQYARDHPFLTGLIGAAGLLVALRPFRRMSNVSTSALAPGAVGLGLGALTTGVILYAALQSRSHGTRAGRLSDGPEPEGITSYR